MILYLDEVSDGEILRRIPHSPNARMHWSEASRWKNAWKNEIWRAWMQQGKPKLELVPGQKPLVTVTMRAMKLMDEDNAHAAVKPLVDGLKPPRGILDSNPGIGVIADDGPNDIKLLVRQVKVEHRDEESVSIEITTQQHEAQSNEIRLGEAECRTRVQGHGPSR